jgi:hypothetical protein
LTKSEHMFYSVHCLVELCEFCFKCVEMYREKNELTSFIIEIANPFVGPPAAEADLLPEYCQYKDEGCDLSSACLSCPLPRCVHEQSWGRFKLTRSLRDREIVRLHIGENKTVTELSRRFQVSRRTVLRALAAVKPASGTGE